MKSANHAFAEKEKNAVGCSPHQLSEAKNSTFAEFLVGLWMPQKPQQIQVSRPKDKKVTTHNIDLTGSADVKCSTL